MYEIISCIQIIKTQILQSPCKSLSKVRVESWKNPSHWKRGQEFDCFVERLSGGIMKDGRMLFRYFPPENKTWLTGKSPFSVGNTFYLFMVDFQFCHVVFRGCRSKFESCKLSEVWVPSFAFFLGPKNEYNILSWNPKQPVFNGCLVKQPFFM